MLSNEWSTSSLRLMVFSNTSTQKWYIYLYVYIYIYIYIYRIVSSSKLRTVLDEKQGAFTKRMIRFIYIYIYIHLKKCSGKCKFQGNISQLVSMHLIWNFDSRLVEHQSCYNQNFKFLAVQEPNFLEPKFSQNWPLTGLCMYIGPASVFFFFTWIWVQCYVELFFQCIWSPL